MKLRHLLQNFRNEYISNGLDIDKMLDNPIDQFEIWLEVFRVDLCQEIYSSLQKEYESLITAEGKIA